MYATVTSKRSPGAVRDAILTALKDRTSGETVAAIQAAVTHQLGTTAASSVRSYLRLNTPALFSRLDRGRYALAEDAKIREETQGSLAILDSAEEYRPYTKTERIFEYGRATLLECDCFTWLARREAQSIHAVVTDPPYGLVEYSEPELAKLRSGRGGVWRIPPSFDGHQRSPLPRFTTLKPSDVNALEKFFYRWATAVLRVLVPGGHVLIASNPLLSYALANAGVRAGLERRGEVIRLTMTMRGGDRPKAAHEEFCEVSMMPRSMWEPWLIFRKPMRGRAQDNLRCWKTGGFRRPSPAQPFGDVITSGPTRASERALAPHPNLKPQAFLRQIVRAVLPLGEGVILDPFAGSGSTLAAAEAVEYQSIGLEKDSQYFELAANAIPRLAHVKL